MSSFLSGGPSVNRETDLPGGRLQIGTPNISYRHVERQSGIPDEALWIELRLNADWVAAYLIEPQDGQMVIAEVRVVPYEDDAERRALLGPGEWSRRQVPSGGVPFEKLRRLRPDNIMRAAIHSVEQLPPEAEYLNEVLADFGLGTAE